MIIKSFTFNPFSTNCYVVTSENETVIIDPSCQSELEHEKLSDYVDSTGSTVKRILLTHAHIDHIFGLLVFQSSMGLELKYIEKKTCCSSKLHFKLKCTELN